MIEEYIYILVRHQTLIKSLGETIFFSFSKVFNFLSLCFVYLVSFYKPFQTFIIYFTSYSFVIPLRSNTPSLTGFLDVYIYCAKLFQKQYPKITRRLGLWCLTPLSTIFQLYPGSQFYCWRRWKYPRKPPTCRKSLTNFITFHLSNYHFLLVCIGIGHYLFEVSEINKM